MLQPQLAQHLPVALYAGLALTLNLWQAIFCCCCRRHRVCRLAVYLKLLVLLMLRFLAEGQQDGVGSTAERKGPKFYVCHTLI